MTEPTLPSLDPNAGRSNIADADRERAKRYLRKKLAEGAMSPSRLRMLRAQLLELERAA